MILNDLSKEDQRTVEDVKEELNKKKNDDSDAFETMLMHVGELGRYQKLLFVGMAPFGIFFAFVYFVQMFITVTPQRHWCKVPELEHLDVELRRNLTAPATGLELERCLMYDANWSQVLLNYSVPPDTPTVPCRNGWEFELKDIPYPTIVSERGWVCEKAGYGPLAQTIFFVGSFIGGIFFGWMADRFGRVPALVGTNLMAFIGGIASIYTTGLWDFSFCRFIVGTSYDSCFMTMYILVLEYVGPRYRTRVANLSIALYFGSGCLMLPWLALWVGDWRRLLWVTTLPFLLVLIVPFTVPESARWLSSRGRVNDAVKVMRRFEKINGKKIPEDVMDDFVVSASQTRQTNESIKDLFMTAPLRRVIILMVLVYMACAIIFDALVRMSDGLGLDFFITFTLASATEIPSVTLLALILDKWGRRILTCGPMGVSGILILIMTLVPKGVPQVSLAILARFAINMSYNAAIQWSAELLPTPVRASGSALIHVSGYVATLVSPFVVFSERLWRPLPILILGVTALFACSVGVLLPETNGQQMPQTIEEGEKLVNSYTLCGKTEVDEIQVENEKEKSLIT
ncbi:organic cation transporter protein-like isoform X2 [Vanessa cardui]|uniref:organic cation transporter protein-like isoform X2 n=1 Tax=Vanessa cardui TaxID=171605 RepID=UPI001F13A748|nr:organic cation transporter protein-like isoform X2 [Vanessa cardui]